MWLLSSVLELLKECDGSMLTVGGLGFCVTARIEHSGKIRCYHSLRLVLHWSQEIFCWEDPGGKNIQISDPSRQPYQLRALSAEARTKGTWDGQKSNAGESWLNPALLLCNLGRNIFSEHLLPHLLSGGNWGDNLRISMCKEPNLVSGNSQSSTNVRSPLSCVGLPSCGHAPNSAIPAGQTCLSRCLV